jgi:hypothetical protein
LLLFIIIVIIIIIVITPTYDCTLYTIVILISFGGLFFILWCSLIAVCGGGGLPLLSGG